jgi:hypothetical protein
MRHEMRYLSVIHVSILALLASVPCLAQGTSVQQEIKPDPVDRLKFHGYLNDFAGIIDSQSQSQLNLICGQLDRNSATQLAIVTVESLEGIPIEDFGTQLANRWGVGHKETNRGILVLLSKADRQYRIVVGLGLETVITDQEAALLGREMIPALRQGDYGKALLQTAARIQDLINAAVLPLSPPIGVPYASMGELDKHIESKYCRIQYAADREQDARQLGADADNALESMARELETLDPQLMDDFACTIFQFSKPQVGAADEGTAHAHTEDRGRLIQIAILARSSFPQASRTLVGETKDEDYTYKLIADELSTVLFERVTRDKGKGWYFHDAPDWFVQGIEGYFGLTHASPHSREVTLPKYIAASGGGNEVSFDDRIQVKNPYLGGLVLVAFLYSVYGAEAVNSLLASPKQTFAEAFTDSFGDVSSVGRKYQVWIADQPSPIRQSTK